MRITLVLTPMSDQNLRLASQVGVTDIVTRYPGTHLDELLAMRDLVAGFGLRLSAVEGYVPMDRIKLGQPGRDEEIEDIRTLIRNMGKAGVEVLCYNFMAGSDWSRTSFAISDRGGALVSGFDASLADRLPIEEVPPMREGQMWDHLEYFLRRVVPVAEEAGVKLALHPDDPPMSPLRGVTRILTSVEAFERVLELAPSPANGICFCQGCFLEMGADLLPTIRRLGKHIQYVHFRDVRGTVPQFVETFHDSGPTDMFQALRAYREVGFAGPMRPDHVPQLAGEESGEPGYTMLGRLWAVGYMRGLMDAMDSTC
ncbi:MAG: mannonate dehydratase [Phycisphaerae bacterium]|nr:mannonate dehydratase [Phycisphaerae bacterium]